MYDLIIIGGGPAGVSSALYSRARGLNVLLIEKEKVGGLASSISVVSHYTGLVENETGNSFSKRILKQLKESGCDIAYEEVIEIDANKKIVKTKSNTYNSKAIIFASGSRPKKLECENIENFKVEHSTLDYLDSNVLQGKEVFVVGGSDGACKEAITLSKLVKDGKVHIVQNEDKLLCVNEFKTIIENSNNIDVITGTSITKLNSTDSKIKEVYTKNGKYTTNDEFKVFVFIGQVANSELLKDTLETENGYIKTNGVNTDIDGFYVVGDCAVKKVRQIATAVNDGVIGAIEAFNYIK